MVVNKSILAIIFLGFLGIAQAESSASTSVESAAQQVIETLPWLNSDKCLRDRVGPKLQEMVNKPWDSTRSHFDKLVAELRKPDNEAAVFILQQTMQSSPELAKHWRMGKKWLVLNHLKGVKKGYGGVNITENDVDKLNKGGVKFILPLLKLWRAHEESFDASLKRVQQEGVIHPEKFFPHVMSEARKYEKINPRAGTYYDMWVSNVIGAQMADEEGKRTPLWNNKCEAQLAAFDQSPDSRAAAKKITDDCMNLYTRGLFTIYKTVEAINQLALQNERHVTGAMGTH
jgi:hypothetical protein